MTEEKIIGINLKKKMLKVPKWKRNAKLMGYLRRQLKQKDLHIDQKLNEKYWLSAKSKIRLKLVKDDKSVKAKLVE